MNRNTLHLALWTAAGGRLGGLRRLLWLSSNEVLLRQLQEVHGLTAEQMATRPGDLRAVRLYRPG